MKKFGILLIVMLSTLVSFAQVATLYNQLGTNLLTDTVTNAGTGFVQIKLTQPLGPKLCNSTVLTVIATKISGTVAGTITIMGSVDGTNYKAIGTNDTQTSVTTATATDVASQIFTWRLAGSPYPWYRISWTGTGTMAGTLSGKMFRN
jgi:hypothetical protein